MHFQSLVAVERAAVLQDVMVSTMHRFKTASADQVVVQSKRWSFLCRVNGISGYGAISEALNDWVLDQFWKLLFNFK